MWPEVITFKRWSGDMSEVKGWLGWEPGITGSVRSALGGVS